MGIKERLALVQSKARGKMQHDVQREKFNRDVEEIGAKDKLAADFRVQTGETDFSLHNWIMTTCDFSECKELLETVMFYYSKIYSYLMIFQRSNEELKNIVAQLSGMPELQEHLNRSMRKRMSAALLVASPFESAQKGLKEISKRARTRSSMGIKSYNEEEAAKLGIDIPRNDQE